MTAIMPNTGRFESDHLANSAYAHGPFGTSIPTRLSNLDVETLRNDHDKETDLGPHYEPKTQDVVCGSLGRGEYQTHPGNERLRVLVFIRLGGYKVASTRADKTKIVKEILEAVRAYGGQFIKFHDGRWFEIGNSKAHEKIGHAVRIAVHKSEETDILLGPRRRRSTAASQASIALLQQARQGSMGSSPVPSICAADTSSISDSDSPWGDDDASATLDPSDDLYMVYCEPMDEHADSSLLSGTLAPDRTLG